MKGWARHRVVAQNFRKGVKNLGLEIFPNITGNRLAVVKIPDYLNAQNLVYLLLKELSPEG